MTLRCKPGDLAVVVRAPVSIVVGRIVRCVRLAPVCHCRICQGRAAWEIEEPIVISDIIIPLHIKAIPDEFLKPIRGEPGRDETLEWAKVPSNKVPA